MNNLPGGIFMGRLINILGYANDPNIMAMTLEEVEDLVYALG